MITIGVSQWFLVNCDIFANKIIALITWKKLTFFDNIWNNILDCCGCIDRSGYSLEQAPKVLIALRVMTAH